MRFKGNGDIVEFNIPKSELDSLNGKQFSSADSEWLEFVTKSKKGMTNDYVSRPMLMNSTPYLKYVKEAVATG